MGKRGASAIVRQAAALVFLVAILGSMETAGAAKEDCPSPRQCTWDQEDFQGNMTVADFSGRCMNSAIRSGANNGKSGLFALYLYESPNCAGDAVGKLNAGESVRSVTAESARFAPKGSA
jgi:Cu/Zn superoxide dismutase